MKSSNLKSISWHGASAQCSLLCNSKPPPPPPSSSPGWPSYPLFRNIVNKLKYPWWKNFFSNFIDRGSLEWFGIYLLKKLPDETCIVQTLFQRSDFETNYTLWKKHNYSDVFRFWRQAISFAFYQHAWPSVLIARLISESFSMSSLILLFLWTTATTITYSIRGIFNFIKFITNFSHSNSVNALSSLPIKLHCYTSRGATYHHQMIKTARQNFNFYLTHK